MSANNSTGAQMSQVRLVLSSIFITIVMVATVIGNSLVIFCVCYFPRLRGRTNYLIVSLAVADWLIGVISDPLKLVQNINHNIWPEHLNSSGCHVYIATDMLCSAVSILSLMAISIDRLIAITDPLKYEERMRPRHVYIMISITWAFGLVCATLSQVSWKDQAVIQSSPGCGIKSKEYITFVAIAAFFVPLVVVLLNYALIFRVAIRHARRLEKDSLALAVNYEQAEQDRTNHNGESGLLGKPPCKNNHNSLFKRPKSNFPRRESLKPNRHIKLTLVKQLKATKTLAVVVGVFTICWLPFFIIFLTWQYCEECFTEPRINFESMNVIRIIFIDVLPVANSAANPIIYTCFNAEFRKAFKRIVWKALKLKRPMDNMSLATTTTYQREHTADAQEAV